MRPIFALSFAAFMVASGLSSDAARAERQRSASFDGLWSVVIVTLQGSCDRSYRYPVRIVGNRVLQAGAVLHDETGVRFLDGPWWRKAVRSTLSRSQPRRMAVHWPAHWPADVVQFPAPRLSVNRPRPSAH